MKKVLMLVMLAASVLSVLGAETVSQKLAANTAKTSLADARSRIDTAIASPEVMSEMIKHLSAQDQVRYLADVNKAISEMPASAEEKTAKFLDANRAALSGAERGNVAALTAEMFATVPPESLTVISERFAKDLFNRSANPNVTYTDKQYEKIATNLMARINERVSQGDNGAPRSALAIAMLVRASNGSPADLVNTLIGTLPSESQELARNEWLPSALGTDGRQQSYEAILASADAGTQPNPEMVLELAANAQFHDAVLADIAGGNTDPRENMAGRSPVVDAIRNALIERTPTFGSDNFGAAGQAGGAGAVPQEPSQYPYQKD